MRKELIIPMVGMTMTEAKVVEWLVPDGAQVAVGDPVLSFETDKSTIDVEAEDAGTVRHGVEPGVTLTPGSVIGWVET